jgi:serine/threonine-protein kinase
MSSGQSPTPTASPNEPGEASTPTIAPGTLVAGRYRVVSWLGEGAMGSVYRVEDKKTREPRALKVLHSSMSNLREAVVRFEREAIAAGKIGHRNVAAATDFGRMPDGSFFLLLEFVAGRSLRSELAGGPLDPRRAIRIMQGVVAGVAAAHAKGIVHRDLKPENIMLVDQDGDPDFVKVLDFGIAKVADVTSAGHGNVAQTLTKAGTVIGTPDYMSPEQALGRAVDERSDLYSLGVVLYELLTGDAPFRGGAATLLRQQVMEQPAPLPRDVIEDGDPMLVEMVDKLLAKKPEERFQSAAELMTMLDAASTALAAKGVLRDFGFRSRSNSAMRGLLRRVVRHLPRSLVAKLNGRRVAVVMGLAFAAVVASLYFTFRAAPDASPGAQPSASPPTRTPSSAHMPTPANTPSPANAPTAATPSPTAVTPAALPAPHPPPARVATPPPPRTPPKSPSRR